MFKKTQKKLIMKKSILIFCFRVTVPRVLVPYFKEILGSLWECLGGPFGNALGSPGGCRGRPWGRLGKPLGTPWHAPGELLERS